MSSLKQQGTKAFIWDFLVTLKIRILWLPASAFLTPDHGGRVEIDHDNIEQKEDEKNSIIMVFYKLQSCQRVD